MGQFKVVPTIQIVPSQDFLKEATFEFILSCLKKDELDKLPPTPIVRKDPASDHYIAIDGHNLIAVFDYYGKDIEVYSADSSEDGLPSTSDAAISRNQDLAEKYESSLAQAYTLQKQGISSFEQLRNKYDLIAG